jgi:glycosyltransferase involved in cell wall biosynthesis
MRKNDPVAEIPGSTDPTVLVLVPALDESRTLASLLDWISVLGYPCLVVDDGSRDGSSEIALAHGAQLIRHSRRLGKGAALLTGFQFARQQGYRWVVTLDGDGQHDPAEIPRLMEVAIHSPRALILGMRGKSSAPWIRAGANRVADFFISRLAALPLQDTQSGFRVYPAEAVSAITDHPPHGRGFSFESAILISLGRLGIPMVGAPVSGNYPRGARPSHFRPVRDSLAISLTLMSRFRFFTRPPSRQPANPGAMKPKQDPLPAEGGEHHMHRSRRGYWSLLLLIPILASLWIPVFNHRNPTLWGIPFFYTYLLAWIPLSGLFNGLVGYLTRKPRSRRKDSP